LGVLAAAMFQRRAAEGRSDMDGKPPSSHQEFFGIIQNLADAGCNLLQARPGDEKPLPKAWTNPLTGQPLPSPRTPDERAVLAKSDPQLLQLLDELEKRPYATINKLRQAEAQRQAVMGIPYTQREHELNTFRGDNKTAHAQFVKRDPDLAK